MNIQKTEIEKEKFDVLLACGDPRMVKNIVHILEEKGCVVKTVSSGRDALDLVCKDPFNVVLTDLLMSPKDRNTILKKSKELNPETIVILLGSGEDIQYDHDTLSFEADDYVFSPSGMRMIWQRVENCLERLELKRKDTHSKELIRKFKEKISRISECVSKDIQGELLSVAEKIELLRQGAAGKIDETAAEHLTEILETVNDLIEETGWLSKGFVPRKRGKSNHSS